MGFLLHSLLWNQYDDIDIHRYIKLQIGSNNLFIYELDQCFFHYTYLDTNTIM